MTLSTVQTSIAPRPRASVTERERKYIPATVAWCAFAILAPLDRYVLQDSSISALVWRVMLALLVLSLLGGRVARPQFPAVWLSALVALPLAGYISGHQSDVSESLTVGIQLALLASLAPFVFRFYVDRSPYFTRVVLAGFLASQTFSAAVGLLQLSGDEVLGAVTVFGRSTGLAGHPNILGIMSALAIFVSLAAWRVTLPRVRGLVIIMLALNASALVATGSLSAMLAVVVGFAIYFLAKRRILATFLVGVLGALAVWVFTIATGLDGSVLWAPVQSRVNVVLGTSEIAGGAASLDTRVLTYQWAWKYITMDPVAGVGLDSLNAGTYNGITPVHNHILHAWYQGGLLFCLWMIAVTVVVIIQVGKSIARRRDELAAAAAITMLAFAATSAFFEQEPYWLPLLLALALIGAPSVTRIPKHSPRPPIRV